MKKKIAILELIFMEIQIYWAPHDFYIVWAISGIWMSCLDVFTVTRSYLQCNVQPEKPVTEGNKKLRIETKSYLILGFYLYILITKILL